MFLFNSFQAFVKEIGPRPSSQHSLDRIDNDGHYEIGNVKWSTRREQQQTRRGVKLTLPNIEKAKRMKEKGFSFKQLAEIFKVHDSTIRRALQAA